MATTPPITRIHHVTLSVTDLDRTTAWYRDVLGFEEGRRLTVDGMTKALLVRDGLLVTFVQHGDRAVGGPFDERGTGLDHLSFAVPDEVALHAWVAHLDAHGVDRGEVAQGTTGHLVAFRDPDHIALEFYTES